MNIISTRVLCAVLTVCAAFCASISADDAGLPSFPGAEGYGSHVTGGRGGKVIHVTNLNPTGPGSLQWACEQQGPRIIVFDVNGVIHPHNIGDKKVLSIARSDITIAGQTAPGAGITIEGSVSTYRGAEDKPVKNVVLRFIRARAKVPKGSGRNVRAIELSNSSDVIVDHVSGCWSIDDCFDLYTTLNTTVQWCTVEESDIWYEGGDEPHNFAMIMSGQRGKYKPISVHHTLIANHRQRTPSCGSYPTDFRNNLIYNGGEGGCNSRKGGISIVGNYLKPGPAGILGPRMYMPPYTVRQPSLGFRKAFVQGNYYPWSGGYLDRNADDPRLLPEEPEHKPVATHTAEEAYRLILAQSGCLPKDTVLRRTIRETLTSTGSYGFHGPAEGLMGGLTPGKPRADTDKDGMPDEWEKQHGLNPRDPEDCRKKVPASASPGDRHKGYTYIEYYINECADTKIAQALTEARLDPVAAEPWDKPANSLSPFAIRHESIESMVKAIAEQDNEWDEKKKTRTSMAWAAVQQFSRMREKAAAAVPELTKLITPDQDRRSSFAAWAVGTIGPAAKGAVPHLIESLGYDYPSGNKKWRFEPIGFIAWALGRIGPAAKEAVPALAITLHGKDGRGRRLAAWALSEMGEHAEPAMDALFKALREDQPEDMYWPKQDQFRIRIHVRDALAHIGKPAIPGLITTLSSENPQARLFAADALGRLGEKSAEALPALIKLLEDDDRQVRGRAAGICVKIDPGNKKAIQGITGLLGDKATSVRHAALKALAQIGSGAQPAVPEIAKNLTHARKEIQRSALLALGSIGGTGTDALTDAARNNPDPFIRKYAVRALGNVTPRTPKPVPALIKGLSDTNRDVRRESAWSLAFLGTHAQGAAENLKKALQDSDYVVRYAAAEALSRTK